MYKSGRGGSESGFYHIFKIQKQACIIVKNLLYATKSLQSFLRNPFYGTIASILLPQKQVPKQSTQANLLPLQICGSIVFQRFQALGIRRCRTPAFLNAPILRLHPMRVPKRYIPILPRTKTIVFLLLRFSSPLFFSQLFCWVSVPSILRNRGKILFRGQSFLLRQRCFSVTFLTLPL